MKKIFITFVFVFVFINIFADTGYDLFDAVIDNDIDKVQNLIDKGADVNAKDKNGQTALNMAAFYNHTEIVKILIQSKAKVNAIDSIG